MLIRGAETRSYRARHRRDVFAHIIIVLFIFLDAGAVVNALLSPGLFMKVKGRPSLDDVERLSRGQAARKRGTGSRAVCHRLNESERKPFELAKRQGYVVLRGTGYRRDRKGSPLLNIFRQFCDAKAIVCISVITGQGPDAADEVEVDFSPLRRAPGANDDLSRSADETVAGFQAVRIDELLGETATVSTGMEATSEGQHTGTEGETRIAGDNDEEEDGAEEELLEGDLRDSPIWRLPVNSRIYRCDSRKTAKDLAEALSSLR